MLSYNRNLVLLCLEVLKELVDLCKVGSSVRELCILSDQKLAEETGKAFKKDKKLTNGTDIIYL